MALNRLVLRKGLGLRTLCCTCAMMGRNRLRCNMQVSACMLKLGVGHPKDRQRAGKLGPFMQEGLWTAGGEVTNVE